MAIAGIEAINVFGGTNYIDVMQLCEHRGLDKTRMANLLIKEKSVAMPWEDPITFAVNAAKPIIDVLSQAEKDSIDMLITCSESGIDFGKSISTYVHDLLDLNRRCRLFELKQACYAGTAGFQMAINFVLSQVSPGAKVLVIASDISRFVLNQDNGNEEEWSYAEPSSGAGAVAMLISDRPTVFQVDAGANGYYGYEVMDTCRPGPDSEAGDSDLSLMSYLDCCEQAFLAYKDKVKGAHYQNSFAYLTFHTPFGGMVKGAHRNMMRNQVKVSPAEIEDDFNRRVLPGLDYCQRVGNIMGGTVFLALAGTIDKCDFTQPQRIGCFSYGSGCCSEFYSGVTNREGQNSLRALNIDLNLNRRYKLNMAEYDSLLKRSSMVRFGTKNIDFQEPLLPDAWQACQDKNVLILDKIDNYHRCYRWLADANHGNHTMQR